MEMMMMMLEKIMMIMIITANKLSLIFLYRLARSALSVPKGAGSDAIIVHNGRKLTVPLSTGPALQPEGDHLLLSVLDSDNDDDDNDDDNDDDDDMIHLIIIQSSNHYHHHHLYHDPHLYSILIIIQSS